MCDDKEEKNLTLAIAEVQGDCREPFDLQRFEGMTANEVLAKAEEYLGNLHAQQVWCEYPTAALGASDFREGSQRAWELNQLAEVLGNKVIVGLGLNIPEERRNQLHASVGNDLISCYYQDLIDDQWRELQAWRQGDWDTLHKAGKISGDDYAEFKEHCPNGSPWTAIRQPGAELLPPDDKEDEFARGLEDL